MPSHRSSDEEKENNSVKIEFEGIDLDKDIGYPKEKKGNSNSDDILIIRHSEKDSGKILSKLETYDDDDSKQPGIAKSAMDNKSTENIKTDFNNESFSGRQEGSTFASSDYAPREFQEYKIIKDLAFNRRGRARAPKPDFMTQTSPGKKDELCRGAENSKDSRPWHSAEDNEPDTMHGKENTSLHKNGNISNINCPDNDDTDSDDNNYTKDNKSNKTNKANPCDIDNKSNEHKISGIKYLLGALAIVLFISSLFFLPQIIDFAMGVNKVNLNFVDNQTLNPDEIIIGKQSFQPQNVRIVPGSYDVALVFSGTSLQKIKFMAMNITNSTTFPKIYPLNPASISIPEQEVVTALSFSLSETNFGNAKIELKAKGTAVYVCGQWNYLDSVCESEVWTKLLDTSLGSAYNITLSDTKEFTLIELA